MLTICNSAKTVTLQYNSMWRVDVNTGVVSYPTTKKRYEAEDAIISGRAGKLFFVKYCAELIELVVSECSDCISKRAVHEGKSAPSL